MPEYPTEEVTTPNGFPITIQPIRRDMQGEAIAYHIVTAADGHAHYYVRRMKNVDGAEGIEYLWAVYLGPIQLDRRRHLYDLPQALGRVCEYMARDLYEKERARE